MPTDTPVSAARFGISVDGQQIATFSELAGISSQVDPVDYMPSTPVAPARAAFLLSQHSARKAPGTIRLRRPYGKDLRLTTWHENAARKLASLHLYDQAGKPVAQYHLVNAWPSKIQPGGASGGIAIETITITVERIERVR